MKLTIGEKIALLRKEKNITQTELAEYLFLAPQTVSRWEVGCGAPEITLLPKIAAFFGVSIDELFGLTSLERTEDLVAKYSVLRDDHSFQEAMEYIDSQIQTIDAVLKNGAGDSAELERDRDQLEAEKTHMWIQQGREAFQRAFAMADCFVQRTEKNPENPWYLPMRLQLDQLCSNIGKDRETLSARKKDFMEHPDEISLLRYLSMLDNRQEYEAILSIGKEEGPVREILFPPSEKNLSIWWQLIHAAAEMSNTDFIEQHLPLVLQVCGKKDEFDFLMCLLNVYRDEQLAAIKGRLRFLLPEVSLNQYFEEKVKERIEETVQIENLTKKEITC
ncbi:MAG: helix-turn-helix transcriptional regulator [Lachnospiraceae bacterium]|nr:helix-turn-helix transcriptional regulator [Lachnospiraceae bacterium]